MQQVTEVSKIGFMQNELLKENIKNLTSKTEIDLNENVEQLKNSVNEYSKVSAFELRQTQAEINEAYNISNKVDDDYNKMLHVQKELQTNHVNSQFSILQDIKNKNNLQVENAVSVIKSFENNIGNCLENFKKYIPTGTTPIRKTYTYPKMLPIQMTITQE
ncbi:kinesin-like protein Klp61F [Centruroides sculpturatus]|uniref:kinesin-like protein Klp61F n=1 Tax=Centruroides sculpturatus TaxID=218467 RepID=UPI000C6EC438|nr:kinesin-like protein Klp61F [Centruroides sculpturatus]